MYDTSPPCRYCANTDARSPVLHKTYPPSSSSLKTQIPKYTNTNSQIQIHKYKFTNTNKCNHRWRIPCFAETYHFLPLFFFLSYNFFKSWATPSKAKPNERYCRDLASALRFVLVIDAGEGISLEKYS